MSFELCENAPLDGVYSTPPDLIDHDKLIN